MTTENIANNTAGEASAASTEFPDGSRQRFVSLSGAIAHGRRHAAKTAEAIESISMVMGDKGVSPHPVDYTKYSLRELAKLREIIKESSFEAIKHAVDAHGASVKELAEAAGISHTTIYRWMEESDKEIRPIPHNVIRTEPGDQNIPYGEFNNPRAVTFSDLIVRLTDSRWLSVYGTTGSGKTNLGRLLVFGALLRGMSATVIADHPEEYRFAQDRSSATVVSTKNDALRTINSILGDDSPASTRIPRVIVIDDLQNFIGKTTSPSGDFLALTDALNTATAKLISRAGELNLHVVTTVQATSENSAERSLIREWWEVIKTAGIDESAHDRMVFSRTGGYKATLRPRRAAPEAGHDLTVKLWDASDQEALGRYLDGAGVWNQTHGR